MQRRLIAYEQFDGVFAKRKAGIAEVKLPDNYGEREVTIAVRQAAELEYLDRFVDLGRVPESGKIKDILKEELEE